MARQGEGKMAWNFKTDTELVAAGYKFVKKGKCRGESCGAELEWWETPRGKLMPIDPGTMQPHWISPDREKFLTLTAKRPDD